MVLLTRDEERNVASCLEALALQRERDFEVILIDAASRDGTVGIVRARQASFPVPLRLVPHPTPLPIGEARNLGVALARAPHVAFLSADAEPRENWTGTALRSLETRDAVFGLQLHDPHGWTVGAAVRGLRYDFPDRADADPLRYASNVAAAYRRGLLEAFPFDPGANAAEDLLLARRAAAAGYRLAYEPRLVVRHHDVDGARQELRKALREGQGWARYRSELGLHLPLLAWGAALLFSLSVLLARPSLVATLLLSLVLWAPAVLRAMRRRRALPPLALAAGVAASPFFDLAFLAAYLGGLLPRTHRRGPTPQPREVPE